ncbi:MAG: class I SAM-dependent methyltransferase [Anaeromyxobacteraceae bacterium]
MLRDFYAAAPFPGYPPRDSYAALRRRAERSEFARLLDQAIPPDATVLEVGCGTGQMCLFLATADRLVVGADLTRASLELAAAAARRFEVGRARFVETDLRAPGLRAGAFDVVYCSGVLHHTPDPEASFRALARLVRPGGFIVLGLYNAYARLPHRLRRAVARLTGLRFVPLDPVLRDRAAEPARREAWLRDQYLHPEEHRHTLAEVQRWFERSGVAFLRTYPGTAIAAAPLEGAALFEPAEDDWALENVLQQLSWSWRLGGEGGLFVTVGQRRGG